MDFDTTKIVTQVASFQEQFFFEVGTMTSPARRSTYNCFVRMKVSNRMVSKGIMGTHYLHIDGEEFLVFLHLKYQQGGVRFYNSLDLIFHCHMTFNLKFFHNSVRRKEYWFNVFERKENVPNDFCYVVISDYVFTGECMTLATSACSNSLLSGLSCAL